MPEFQLDTAGSVATGFKPELPGMHGVTLWRDLDAFTQGYTEALFFTSDDGAGTMTTPDQMGYKAIGFADLAPETLASIIADCAAFRAQTWVPSVDTFEEPPLVKAGRDFWYTRNGHGVGFWDGDWPEPYATALDKAAKAFGASEPYLGDDGKVYLS